MHEPMKIFIYFVLAEKVSERCNVRGILNFALIKTSPQILTKNITIKDIFDCTMKFKKILFQSDQFAE